ncbi:cadherin repeat domain-containing protein [uncultured Fibrobacter sp.]|uniref:cadherin repeat domain-containing protein n=1 Tax=uncultured Fibrobacter sp. TaxID=261512 RepID=UPI00262DA1CC|nr:cadherin repeat domain-containing protein [uncultured Fibrobacter sp.]
MLKGSVKMIGMTVLLLGLSGGAFAASVAPLYFESLGSSVADNPEDQQQYWEDLMKYKLWGSDGLTFNKENVHIADLNGYNGTSTGDISFYNGRHHVGGPLLSGGNFNLSNNGTTSEFDTLSGGPMRTLGNMILTDWKFNNNIDFFRTNNRYEGPFCVNGRVETASSNQYDNTLANLASLISGGVYASSGVVPADEATADSVYVYDVTDPETGDPVPVTEYYKYVAYPFAVGTYQSCPAEVPSVDTHLRVPIWPESENTGDWAPAISLNQYDQVGYIHVPPESVYVNEYGTYDLYIEKISMCCTPNTKLYVVMPPGGRLTRIFTRGGVSIDNSANSALIQVIYVSAGTTYDRSTNQWDLSKITDSNYVSNAKYAGNLMFYTNEDIDWNSMINPSFQGTFMTTGKLTIKDHFTLAGQLVANNLWFESDIIGDFRYVPFDPPILNIDPELLENGAFPENNVDAEIPISLDERTNTSVDFNYCFDLDPALSTAERADFTSTAKAPFPICEIRDTTWGNYVYDEDGVTKTDSSIVNIDVIKDSGYVRIAAGRLYPTDEFKAYLNVLIDGLNEGDEFLHMKIFNLAGAVLPGNEREGHFNLKIIDGTTSPVASASSVNGTEDLVYVFKTADFSYYSSKDYAELGIFVSTVPSKGVLTYLGDTLTDRKFIPVDSISELKYYGKKDDNGTPYVTFLFQVKDEKNAVSGSAVMSVNIAAVNDAPSAVASTFTVAENSSVNAAVTGSLVAKDVDDEEFVYSLVGGDSSIFKIDASTGAISVKKAVLDYETKSSYSVTVRVRDMSASTTLADTLSYELPVSIVVTDVNEKPVLAEQEFGVKENQPANAEVGTVVFTELDTALLFREDMFTVVGGATDIFAISPEGVITTKKVLDFEKDPGVYTLDVKLSDKNDPTVYVTKTMTIKLSDENETPVLAEQEFGVEENLPVDSEIGTVVFTEPDTALLYKEDEFTAVGGDTALFAISADGVITTKKVFDFEQDPGSYTLVVKLSDKNDPAIYVEKTMTINLVDKNEKPALAEQNFEIKENLPKNSEVGTVTFSEPDTSLLFREDVFTAVGGDTAVFAISPEGVITTKKVLDFEKDPGSYTLVVKLSDKNDPTVYVTKTMTIDLTDENEYPVLVEQTFGIEENMPENSEVGTVVFSEPDTALLYKEDVFTAVGGDTAVFAISPEGVITAKKTLDFEKDPATYTIVVKLTDKNDPSISVTKTMTVNLLDKNESPVLVDQSFEIDEHQVAGTVVDTVVFDDLDKDPTKRVDIFTAVAGDTAFFSIDNDGVIRTKKEFNYETERRVYTIDVALTDATDPSLKVVKTMTIEIRNINENPVIVTEKVSVVENSPGGTVVDTVKAIDNDLDDSVLTYKLAEPSKYFDVSKNGVITVKKGVKIDYETVKTTLLVVEVSDSHGGSSRKTITVDIVDIPPSSIEITTAENADSTWKNPDTLYTNLKDIRLYCSVNGGAEELCADTTLKEGKNVIIKKFNDPSLDGPASDTVVVFVSTAAPVVTVTANPDDVKAANIYTIVEKTDEADTNIYVNDTRNDILVTVKDPASKKDTSFTVKLNLETLSVPESKFSSMVNVAKETVALNENPSTPVTRTPVNGTEVKVSYTEKVAGKEVTVSYKTDNNGNVIKRAVVNEKGKVDSIEVITVTRVTTIDGKEVTISYEADAVTGAVLYDDGDGNLVTSSAAAEKKSGSKSSTTVGMFTVTYDYVDAAGNTVVVTYPVDKKGNLVKNSEGNIGYSVAYTYVNKYGNAATQSVFIVLDQIGPTVEILSPEEGAVVRSNFVNVVWTVNGVEQDTLTLQGLEKGANVIVRFYRDKAGNEASDTVYVVMKDSKNVEIAIEQPVTEITKEKVAEYYAVNPPKPGQTFAVSIKNPTTEKEVETLIGGEFKTKAGSGEEPYPGVSGSDHLGPTLALDIRLPVVNGVGGLATLDDLLSSDGMIPLEGVDAENSTKVSVEEFVEEYCEDGLKIGSDISRLNLYKSQMNVKIWVYTSLGNFVDYFSFTQDMNDPDYTNDAGMLQMFFEMKPDKEGYVKAENGKLIGTGAYLYKVEATIKSHLRCTLPPVADPSGKKKGDIVKSSDDLLKPFGYKRPKD